MNIQQDKEFIDKAYDENFFKLLKYRLNNKDLVLGFSDYHQWYIAEPIFDGVIASFNDKESAEYFIKKYTDTSNGTLNIYHTK